MDAVQLELAGSDRSVVFVRVRTNPTSQVFACFRVQWTRAPSLDFNCFVCDASVESVALCSVR
jgi:hypothetical protein